MRKKYKEQNPEKYADTVEKVIKKGSTPAGMHISICVNEILDFLDIRPGMQGLDATLGYGGHTTEMLKKLEGQGHMYGLDVDPIEIVKTKARLKERGFDEDILTVKQMNFADIDKLVPETGLFDFVLADLGVSSMQIDNPERGFYLQGGRSVRPETESGKGDLRGGAVKADGYGRNRRNVCGKFRRAICGGDREGDCEEK